MRPEEAKVAAAFGNSAETLERYGRPRRQVEYNSDEARIAAAFGHVLAPGPVVSTNANRDIGKAPTGRGAIVFGMDRKL